MLEPYNIYSIKEIGNLKDFFTIVYTIIDDIYKRVTPTYIKNRRNSNNSIMSDSEIITIRLVGELFTIDSEQAWFGFCRRNMRDLFPNFCDRTRFNRIHRSLHTVIEAIRKEVGRFTEYAAQTYRIVDSIPIPVCKFGRAHFHKTFRGQGIAYGKCPSKKETYFQEAFELRKRYGYSFATIIALNNLLSSLELNGRLSEAIRLAENVIAEMTDHNGVRYCSLK